MDSKLVKDSRLADLLLANTPLSAVVSEIPGASIVTGNVALDLSKFGPNASVVIARIGSEIASVSVLAEVATLDFTSVATSASILEVVIKLEL